VESEVQRRIDQLGERLKRSVVLNDPHVRATHASLHYGDEDEVRIKGVMHRDAGSRVIAHVLEQGVEQWTRPGRIPAAPHLGLLGRLFVPVRWHGEVLGAVLVIDADESLTSAEIELIEQFAHEAAGLIVADRHAADQRAMADEQDIDAWLGREAPARERGRAGLVSRGLLPDLDHVRVLVVEALPVSPTDEPRTHVALRHAIAAVRSRVRGTALGAVRSGRGALALVSAAPLGDARTHEIAETVRAQVRDVIGRDRSVSVGVGREVTAVTDAWRSRDQATLAARAVPLLDAGPVAHWDTLGALQLLLRIPADELDEALVPAPVAALVAADPQGRLLATLEQYLRRGGAGAATAADLHVHRTTLYYRLDRIREITGLDVDDGEVRLHLHLGLVARRLVAGLGRP
jgi:sugar diacid utilization regulator